jgi:hypothetical protein
VLGEDYSFTFGQASSEDLPHEGPCVVIATQVQREVPEADWDGADKFGFSRFARTAAVEADAYVELVLQAGHVEGLLAIGIGPQLVWTRIEEFLLGIRRPHSTPRSPDRSGMDESMPLELRPGGWAFGQ